MRKPAQKRRVKPQPEPKTERIEIKTSETFKTRWLDLHRAHSTNASDVMRHLMEAYMNAVERGKRFRPPFEIRERKP